jgi:probable HAF family extracellular repeat protein
VFRSYRAIVVVLSLTAATLGPASLTARAAPKYTVVDLGTLAGFTDSQAAAINNAGLITGRLGLSSDTHAFTYANGHMTDLGNFGFIGAVGVNLNDLGQVIIDPLVPTNGGAAIGEGVNFLFDTRTGVQTQFATLGGSTGLGREINNSGQVAGESSFAGTPAVRHAVLYSSGGAPTDLGTLGGPNSTAFGLNDRGEAVGFSRINSGSSSHAFLYSNGHMTDLGTVAGSESSASDINNKGQIAGLTTFAATSSNQHAFLYDNGQMVDIGTLATTSNDRMFVRAINDNTQIVGFVGGGNPSGNRAWLWQDGQMSNLNDLVDPGSGLTLNAANDINDRGQIVGYGTTVGGQIHAFLLDPITAPPSPAPVPVALWPGCAAGLALFLSRMRSRRNENIANGAT